MGGQAVERGRETLPGPLGLPGCSLRCGRLCGRPWLAGGVLGQGPGVGGAGWGKRLSGEAMAPSILCGQRAPE